MNHKETLKLVRSATEKAVNEHGYPNRFKLKELATYYGPGFNPGNAGQALRATGCVFYVEVYDGKAKAVYNLKERTIEVGY